MNARFPQPDFSGYPKFPNQKKNLFEKNLKEIERGSKINFDENGVINSLNARQIFYLKAGHDITNMSMMEKFFRIMNNFFSSFQYKEEAEVFSGDEKEVKLAEKKFSKTEEGVYHYLKTQIKKVQELSKSCLLKKNGDAEDYQKLISDFCKSAIEISKLRRELKGTKIEFYLKEDGYDIKDILNTEWNEIKTQCDSLNSSLLSKIETNLDNEAIENLKKIIVAKGSIVLANKFISNISELIDQDFNEIESLMNSLSSDLGDSADIPGTQPEYERLKIEEIATDETNVDLTDLIKRLEILLKAKPFLKIKELTIIEIKQNIQIEKKESNYAKGLNIILTNIDKDNFEMCSLLMKTKEGLKKAIDKLMEMNETEENERMQKLMIIINDSPETYGIVQQNSPTSAKIDKWTI